ncbi:MAG: HD domain-containing protein [Deltaproteobacteria bacterium]|jgi:HD-GYP domain-containing protein (c-di-GMP phosphodiesterase class II)|nr:HD domain-containing protein [Deltaproteobacteria bacterium]
MSYASPKKSPPPVEILTTSLLRLPQLQKIHQPNNKLFVESLDLFKKSLTALWETTPTVSVRSHRGRLYLNSNRVPTDKTFSVTVTRFTEFLESRKIFGINFLKTDALSDDAIVDFFRELNQAALQKEPNLYLLEKLEGNWANVIADKDFNIAVVMATDSSGNARPVIWNAGVRTLALKAKKSYSRALAVLTGLNDKLSEGQAVNINKPRRVVQDMVEGLFQDENLLLSLSTIRDYDDYTCTHSVNVAILSMCLGKRVGLSKLQIMTLGLSALFHDLGKVDIPIELIRKTSKFTDDEYALVKHHPLHSVLRILRINAEHNLKSKLLISPFEHHLGVDLGGYPSSGRVSPMTLFGRIVAISDHYDALTSSRSYRPIPISPEQALDIMLQVSGSQLDQILLKVFINMIGIYPVGTLLLLDTREIGMVSQTIPGSDQGRPLCYLLDFEENQLIRGDLVDLTLRNHDGSFVRNILRCFHPTEFGLNPSDFLL